MQGAGMVKVMEPRNLPAEVHRVLRVRTAVQVHPWRRKATTSSERPFARHSGCAWYGAGRVGPLPAIYRR